VKSRNWRIGRIGAIKTYFNETPNLIGHPTPNLA
jgi:hypothetical protein